jgi:hypothetical protein
MTLVTLETEHLNEWGATVVSNDDALLLGAVELLVLRVVESSGCCGGRRRASRRISGRARIYLVEVKHKLGLGTGEAGGRAPSKRSVGRQVADGRRRRSKSFWEMQACMPRRALV